MVDLGAKDGSDSTFFIRISEEHKKSRKFKF
jgi:hypothetical protein